MTITQLIDLLQSYRDDNGDLEVEVCNPAGNLAPIDEIQVTNYNGNTILELMS